MLIKSAFCAVPLGLSVTSGHTHSRARWVTLHLDNYPTSTAITTHVSYNTNPCGIRSGAGPCLTPDGIQNDKKMEAVIVYHREPFEDTHTHLLSHSIDFVLCLPASLTHPLSSRFWAHARALHRYLWCCCGRFVCVAALFEESWMLNEKYLLVYHLHTNYLFRDRFFFDFSLRHIKFDIKQVLL